jgi:ABC-type Fe3+-hydroxamate transport system substrate-binding protein
VSSLVRRAAALALVMLAAGLTVPAGADAPKRIVALSPFSANTLGTLGVRPIAVGQTLGGDANFLPSLRRVRTLPLAHPNGPNMEQLASLRPGLVLSSPTWRRGARTMRNLDIRVVETEPRSVPEMYEQIERIAGIVERRRAGRRLVARIEREVSRATHDWQSRPRVLLVLGVGRTPYAFLPNSWGGDLLQRAGARLVTADAESRSGFARISDENVLAEDPDVIIGVPHARPDDLEGIRDYMRSNETWQLTSAGQNDRIYVWGDDALLQADIDVGSTISRVRARFLHNR